MRTIEDVYLERCYIGEGGKPVPHFWVSKPFPATPLTLYGDDRLPVREEWGVREALELIIGSQLELEIPVGECVLEAAKGELPTGQVWKLLLKSNSADEPRHLQGFEHAAAVYPVSQAVREQCRAIAVRWQDAHKRYHPLMVPMVLEVGVFLVALGVLRIVGGRSLMSLASKIAEDESRHTTTNVSALIALGIDPYHPPQELENLRRDTLEILVGGLDVPERAVGDRLNLDFLMRASNELISTGDAEDFTDISFVVDRHLPFEIDNNLLYTRAV